jgi:hypothetical protein
MLPGHPETIKRDEIFHGSTAYSTTYEKFIYTTLLGTQCHV